MRSNGVIVATDRLGSVRGNESGERMSYYPYGGERTSTADGREKFGTYFRDSAGLDYADQRYYQVGTGRFNTADPSGISAANPMNPGSWNRYAYAYGDPITFNDPLGLDPYCGPNRMWDGEGCTDGASSEPPSGCFVACEPTPPAPSPGPGPGPLPPPQGDYDDPCNGIKQDIQDTINGVGMPGDKSLLTRVVQQITGDPTKFDGHQEQIQGYRNRLLKLKNLWKKDDCNDPDDPPFGTNKWITDTSGGRLRKLQDQYQGYLKDVQLIAAGAGTAYLMAQAAQLLAGVGSFIESLPALVPVW